MDRPLPMSVPDHLGSANLTPEQAIEQAYRAVADGLTVALRTPGLDAAATASLRRQYRAALALARLPSLSLAADR